MWYMRICMHHVLDLTQWTQPFVCPRGPFFYLETTTKPSGCAVPRKHALLSKQWWRAWLMPPWPELCVHAHHSVCSVCTCVPLGACSCCIPFPPGSRRSCINLSALMIGRATRGDAQWQGPPRFIRPPKDQIHTALQAGVTAGYPDTHRHTHTQA